MAMPIRLEKIIEMLVRMALLSDLPTSVPGITLNRLCASGMEAIISGSRMIKSNEGEFYFSWRCRKYE